MPSLFHHCGYPYLRGMSLLCSKTHSYGAITVKLV